MSHRDVDVRRLLEAFGRSKLEIEQLHDLDAANVLRIRELEEANIRLSADNALLVSVAQKDIETVRMEKPAQELIPDSVAQAEQPATFRIIRSRTQKGDGPGLE